MTRSPVPGPVGLWVLVRRAVDGSRGSGPCGRTTRVGRDLDRANQCATLGAG